MAMAGNKKRKMFIMTTEKPQKLVTLKDNQPLNKANLRVLSFVVISCLAIKPSRNRYESKPRRPVLAR